MEIKKSVLIIAPYFPPQTHAAVFRAYKLAKYLPDHGYDIHVITVDTNYLHNRDESLLDDLPDNVKIHRARYIEPSLRGARMAMGGEDRTFSSIKNRSTREESSEEYESGNQLKGKSLASKIYSSVIENTLSTPDSHWTWSRPATRLAIEVIDKYEINTLYTTANPFSVLKIGLALVKERKLKWIADFRDPLGYGARFMAGSSKKRSIQDRLMTAALRRADVITGLSSTYGSIFADIYNVDCNNYRFIPTGLDDDYMKEIDSSKRATIEFTMVFVGEFLKEYNPSYFFDLLKSLEGDVKIRVRFFGRKEINQKLIRNYFDSTREMLKLCEFIDHIPQKRLYLEICKADACLLLPGKTHWWNSFAKMVDYIALGKSVIAMVPDVSEARRELEKSGIGWFLTGDKESDVNLLKKLISREHEVGALDYRRRYLASSQVKEFAMIIEELSSLPA